MAILTKEKLVALRKAEEALMKGRRRRENYPDLAGMALALGVAAAVAALLTFLARLP